MNSVKLPPPVIFIVCILIMYILPKFYLFDRYLYLVVSSLLLSSVFAITSVCQFIINKANISPINLNTDKFITTGIYRFTRNPMYLSLVLALVAWFFWLGNLLAIFGIVLFVILINYLQIKPEEKVLEKIFGQDYLIYKKKVRRWI
ncbi:protein-S-isoprenylcysteine O-methyltransferase Ste14 [Bisgaardia hudsonensis]|uniref:Protein-S-isoprenylcysteine O-methyltransferase Ste14 n=1 Tax=Bisgaardia hudsonensis TaxID=109472 RepID=A0A4R2N2S7_9PAST|nr:hypothetical protein A6A11_03035 [Bisgaardia hudsonensis]TCP14196.1 protein-S-isoprenylcysteine O-methyltransferase Ste14 [Bisgaardia hudsonensis]